MLQLMRIDIEEKFIQAFGMVKVEITSGGARLKKPHVQTKFIIGNRN